MTDKERIYSCGGLSYSCTQLWVKLPRRDEMIKPRLLDITSPKIPLAQTGDGSIKVKIIEGEALDVRAINYTQAPVFYLHFTLQPRAKSSITSTKIIKMNRWVELLFCRDLSRRSESRQRTAALSGRIADLIILNYELDN